MTRCTLAAVTVLAVTVAGPAALATDVETAREQVAELGREVEAADAEYTEVEARLAAQQDRVAAAEARAAGQARLVTEMEDELAALAVETFKRGSVDPQLSLLASGDLDLLSSTSTLTLVAERRSLSLNDVRAAKEELDRLRSDAQGELAEVQVLEADLAQRRADIEKRLEGAKDLLAVAEAEEQARLAAEEQARVAAEQARQQEQASRESRSNAPAPAGAQAVAPAPSNGRFTTPVPGRLTSPFGWRIHPIHGERRMHNGIDIANSCGTPVVAATDGTVSSAKWNGSYGNIVVIEHADGISTAYAHLEGFAATSGPVSRGQVIGYLGTTGLSTGCHLHFEVRVGGEPVDPAGFI